LKPADKPVLQGRSMGQEPQRLLAFGILSLQGGDDVNLRFCLANVKRSFNCFSFF
jgi:hypothetical protein